MGKGKGLPLQDRKAYNEYMKNYQKRLRVRLKAYTKLLNILMTNDEFYIFASEGQMAIVPTQNLAFFFKSAPKAGIPVHEMKCFHVTSLKPNIEVSR